MKKLQKNKNYTQGIYKHKFPEKYKGSLPCIFRSGLELKSFRYLDNNPNVISWGSESIIVPYISPKDGRMHRYFVDLIAKLKRKDGTTQILLIEVKPEKQTLPPAESKRKKQSTLIYEKVTYAVNLAKWQAAKAYADKKGMTFIIMNEKHLQ